MKPTDDKKLVEACLRNDPSAQKRLYEYHSPKLLGLCMRYTESREEAEDVLIEGFVKVFAHLGDFRFDCSLDSWMKKIMLNTAISHFRQHSKHYNQLSLDDLPEMELKQSQEQPSDQLYEKELLELVQQMPEILRVVFNLFVVEGYSHKEIGEMLEIQESSSRSCLTRARNWLKERLSSYARQGNKGIIG